MGDTTQILQLNVRLSISVPMMEKAASGPTVFSVLMELSSTRVSSFATGGSTSTAQRLLQLVAVQLILLVIATVQEVDRQGTSHSGSGDELSPYRLSVMFTYEECVVFVLIKFLSICW